MNVIIFTTSLQEGAGKPAIHTPEELKTCLEFVDGTRMPRNDNQLFKSH